MKQVSLEIKPSLEAYNLAKIAVDEELSSEEIEELDNIEREMDEGKKISLQDLV